MLASNWWNLWGKCRTVNEMLYHTDLKCWDTRTYSNNADPDQAALKEPSQALIRVYTDSRFFS